MKSQPPFCFRNMDLKSFLISIMKLVNTIELQIELIGEFSIKGTSQIQFPLFKPSPAPWVVVVHRAVAVAGLPVAMTGATIFCGPSFPLSRHPGLVSQLPPLSYATAPQHFRWTKMNWFWTEPKWNAWRFSNILFLNFPFCNNNKKLQYFNILSLFSKKRERVNSEMS